MSSVRCHFFVFRNSVEKLCVSWALPFVECVAVWALKPPVVSAPLRSLHNRSPPDFLQLIPTYSNPRVAKFFYGITGTQRTNSKYLAHTSEKTVLPTKKTALSTPPQSYNKNQSSVSHIVRKFHFRVLDANQFGLPVIYPEKFCRKWVQMRKYQACVFYMPILLRICPSGSAHYLQTFPDKLLETKNISPNT